MIRHYDLSDFEAVRSDFLQAYSPAVKARASFTQKKDAVVSGWNDAINDYDYVSFVTAEKFAAGTKASVRCSFDKFGAPLIVFTNDLNGDVYGLHFEAVAFEEGINVWHIVKSEPGSPKPVTVKKIGFTRFPVAAGEPFTLTVEFGYKEIRVSINGNGVTVACEDIPEEFHVGFTGCEGVNRFYEFTVETDPERNNV